VQEYAPGLLAIGSNGSGDAFALDLRQPSKSPVVSVPFIGMDLDHVSPIAENFDSFLQQLALR
jgi:hypothetical protein